MRTALLVLLSLLHFRLFAQSVSVNYKEITFQQRNFYDLQGAGTPQQIWQDPQNPDFIHAVYTYSEFTTGSNWPNRVVLYLFSSDRGLNWEILGPIFPAVRTGYGAITGLSNGAALIAAHSGDNVNPLTNIYVDAFPGLGSFTVLQPGSARVVGPKIISTQSMSLSNKFVFITATRMWDSTYLNIGTSLSSGNFSGYKKIDAGQGDQFALGRGNDGRIGIAYTNSTSNFPDHQGDVYFCESTNNGTSFSSPLKIFQYSSVDSLAGYKGISIVYQNNIPKVFFETVQQPYNVSLPSDAPSKIRVWSSDFFGTDPNRSNVLADIKNVPRGYGHVSADFLSLMCKPCGGVSNDGTMLFCSFMVMNSAKKDSSHYYDIYLARSTNGGLNWLPPKKINPSQPRNDWKYSSISPVNDNDAGNYYVNMFAQKDTMPSENILNSPDAETNAKPVFIRIAYPRTGSAPSPPSLILPDNNAENVSLAPLLDWSDTGGLYNLQVSADSNFNSFVINEVNLETSGYQIPFYLSPGSSYYWRVCSANDFGYSSFSSRFRFTVSPTALIAPLLISPANNSIGQTQTPTLRWNRISNAISYNAQLAIDLNFNNIIYSASNITDTAHIIEPGTLAINTFYYWRVRASNSAGFGPYSEVWKFKTLFVGVNQISELIPTSYKLYYNYPNPFNPTTKIKFDLPKSSFVKINVFDITGRMISELANTNLQAGSYETEFNGGNISSGIYYYRIEAGNFVETKKMILIK